jgi:medium-chain acyl-[acyl-carrier-protein] hydrolase
LPFAGGAASAFFTWSRELPEEIEAFSVQLPGREGRRLEKPFFRLMPLVEELLYAIRPCLEKRYALFGHSMGALIVFELARRLRSLGAPSAVHLFMSGRGAPQIPERDPLHNLPETELVKRLRRLKGTPEIVLNTPELLGAYMPLLRADLAVAETYVYVPQAPLAIPITALGGLEDAEVPLGDLELWRTQTLAGFRIDNFPGDHFFLRSAKASVLRTIGRDLLSEKWKSVCYSV